MHDTQRRADDASLPRVGRTVLLAVAVPVFIIATLAGVLAWELRVVADNDRAVAHTYEVIASTWRVDKLLVDQENGLRSYTLTGDDSFLEPYRRSGTQIPDAIAQLRELVADNPAEESRVRSLSAHYQQWLGSALAALSDLPPGGPVATSPPRGLETLKNRRAHMDAIHETAHAILAEEGGLLRKRQLRAHAEEARLFWVGALAAILLAILGMLVLRHVIRLLGDAYLKAYRGKEENARRAEEANHAKDEFLAVLSHELRTPLNAISGWSHILLGEGVDPSTTRKGAEIIHRNAMAQAQLISDILDVSKIITGKVRLNVAAVDLAAVAERAIESVAVAAEAKNIRIESVLDPATPISGDADRLQQIVWNLLSNAIKFTPKGGRVQVRVERVNSTVEIVVGDNGPGIAPELLPHVFERFRQGDTSVARAHGGLGLGLAIVRHLTELHGGVVTAGNREGRSGAVFTVRLPLRVAVRADFSAPGASRGDDITRGVVFLSGIRVLAVDDDPDSLELLREVLAQCGAEIVVASTAEEALSKLIELRPHVVIADVAMPGVDGYAFMGSVRTLPADAGGSTPALALTALAGAEDRLKALRAGFQMHIAKPVDTVALPRLVRELALQGPASAAS